MASVSTGIVRLVNHLTTRAPMHTHQRIGGDVPEREQLAGCNVSKQCTPSCHAIRQSWSTHPGLGASRTPMTTPAATRTGRFTTARLRTCDASGHSPSAHGSCSVFRKGCLTGACPCGRPPVVPARICQGMPRPDRGRARRQEGPAQGMHLPHAHRKHGMCVNRAWLPFGETRVKIWILLLSIVFQNLPHHTLGSLHRRSGCRSRTPSEYFTDVRRGQAGGVSVFW